MDKPVHDEIIRTVNGWKGIFLRAVEGEMDMSPLFPGKTVEELTYAQILSAGGVAVTPELVSAAIATAEIKFGGFSQLASDQMREPARMDAHLAAGILFRTYSETDFRLKAENGHVIIIPKSTRRAPRLAAVFRSTSVRFQMLEMFYETGKKDVIGLPDTLVYDFGSDRGRAFSVKAVGNLNDDPRLAKKIQELGLEPKKG
jgi:hypothetical protein